MSTSINQIIEVRKDGKWQYVPVVKNPSEENSSIQKCGSVRDVFAYKWYNADTYLQNGVPEDISKKSREAMIHEEQDYITSGACWISAAQFEALIEEIRNKYSSMTDRLVNAQMKNEILDRLDRIEGRLWPEKSESKEDKEEIDVESDIEYIQEESCDLMWAWVNLERNWSEIESYVSYFTNDDYSVSDIRVIMFVS